MILNKECDRSKTTTKTRKDNGEVITLIRIIEKKRRRPLNILDSAEDIIFRGKASEIR